LRKTANATSNPAGTIHAAARLVVEELDAPGAVEGVEELDANAVTPRCQRRPPPA
jgi:hypothetical protein